MIVEKLFIYPIKSCAGFEVEEIVFEAAGPRWDRQWVIVDENHRFITQRQLPQLARIKTKITSDFLEIKIENEILQIPLKIENSRTEVIQVWKASIDAHLESETVNHKISEFLSGKFRLMRFGSKSKREVMIKDQRQNASVRFVDGMPVLLVNRRSLQDLNSRLSKPVPFDRFRPNILVNEGQAFDEDHWVKARSDSGIDLEFSTKCGRCAITTVDQQHGVITGPEPLATLAKYRRQDRGVYFGRYLIHRSLGKLVTGESLAIL